MLCRHTIDRIEVRKGSRSMRQWDLIDYCSELAEATWKKIIDSRLSILEGQETAQAAYAAAIRSKLLIAHTIPALRISNRNRTWSVSAPRNKNVLFSQ